MHLYMYIYIYVYVHDFTYTYIRGAFNKFPDFFCKGI